MAGANIGWSQPSRGCRLKSYPKKTLKDVNTIDSLNKVWEFKITPPLKV